MSDIRAYYNEIDPYAADWLRALMAHGLIASGDVDTRSIIDVRSDDLRPYTQCHFFAGIGGWSYALRQAGWDDTRPVWTGSCPCQPFSSAGRQRGFNDARHLWPVWRELIRECNPAVVFGEQVASATEWLGLVRSDLEAMGRAVGAMPIEASSAGADHKRDRFWFVGVSDSARRPAGVSAATSLGHGRSTVATGSDLAQPLVSDQRRYTGNARGTTGASCAEARPPYGNAADCPCSSRFEWVVGADGKSRRVEPGVRLLAHGIPDRVAKLRGLGNAIDPRPAAAFIEAADHAMRASSVCSNQGGDHGAA